MTYSINTIEIIKKLTGYGIQKEINSPIIVALKLIEAEMMIPKIGRLLNLVATAAGVTNSAKINRTPTI